jgi:hypothetical protein
VQILNVVMGAVGKTVVFGPDHNVGKLARFQELSELVGKMRGGEVGVLLVHDSNPAYTAPQVGLADALRSGNVFTSASRTRRTRRRSWPTSSCPTTRRSKPGVTPRRCAA